MMGIFFKIMGFEGTGFEHLAAGSIYVAAVSYSLTLAMLNVLVPLYALHLGYDLKTMGAIVSSQAIFQLGLRLFGGMLSDRFGERIVLFISFLAVLVGAVMFVFVSTVAGLVWAQVFVGFSRSIYWNAAQSYGSRVNEAHAGSVLGRFLGYGSTGQILGAVIAGTVAETLGYPAAFGVCAGFCSAALVTSLIMPGVPRKDASRSVMQILKPLPHLLTSKVMWMGILVAFVSSSQAALVGSTYPAFFKQELGFNAQQFGIYRSVYASGLVIIGFVFSPIMARFGQKRVFALCMLGMGVLTLLTPTAGYPVLIPDGRMPAMTLLGAFMLILGAVYGISRVLYPVIAAQNSLPVQRGLAMSVVGLGWAGGQLVIPALFGYVAHVWGLANSFYIAGAGMLLVGFSTPLIYGCLSSSLKQ